MYEDPVVAEIRKYRQEHSEKHGNNLDRIYIDLREQQEISEREVIKREPRIILPQTGS